MTTVLKIALPGIDVQRATPEECSIHSDYPAPKIDSKEQHFLNFTINFVNEPPDPPFGGSQTTTILYYAPHNYKYTPQLWTHIEYTLTTGISTLTFGPGDAFLGQVTALDSTYLRVYADATNYYIAIEKNSGLANEILHVAGTTVYLRLYILADGVLDDQ